MRILAVRGRNIASLAGDFEVRLNAAPLRSAGVFAITGPTGSGKSTLLDAICLALYDATPRLAAAGGAKIGRDDEDEDLRIGANDVRNLLRKGTGEGYAEVDFVGIDSEIYTARWEVRRAHRSPSGRLQKTEMSLVATESGAAVGGTKTEVLDEIEQRIGLSFEQFRRSVLLAQGDFAAFLDANDRDRASLLQRITGTEIYSEISKRAFERAREERQALAALAGEHDRIVLLTDEQRDAAAGRIESLEVEENALRATQTAAGEALDWFAKLSDLRAARDEAKSAADAAAAAQAEAVELHRQLENVRRALPLRSKLEGVDAAGERVAKARQSLDAERATAMEAAEAETARQKDQDDALKAEKAAEQAQRDAAPAIKKARELDTLLTAARSDLEKRTEAARSATEAAGEADQRAAELLDETNALERRRDDAGEWLRAHEELRVLAGQWDRWKERLTQYRDAHADLAKLVGEREDLLLAEESTRESLAEVSRQIGEAQERLASLRSDAQRLQKAAAEQPIAALREEEKRARDRADALGDLREMATEVPSRVEAVGKEERGAQIALAKAEEAKQVLAEASSISNELRPQLEQARRAAERAVAAGGASEIRGTLEPGEPCPVCGSKEHPWADQTPELSTLIREEKKRVEELETTIATADTKQTEAKKEIQTQETRAAEARERRAEAEKALRELEKKWTRARESVGAAGLPEDPRAEGVDAAVDAALGNAQDACRQIGKRLSEANALQDEATRASGAAASQQESVDQLAGDHKIAENAHRDAGAALADCDRDIDRLRQTMTRAADTLREPLETWRSWRERLEKDPGELAAACEARVGEWISHRGTREAAEQELAELRPELEAAQAQAGERRKRAADLEVERANAAEEEARLAAERQELLEGRPADQVERELQTALEAQREKTETARGQMHAAAKASATAGTAAREAARALDDRTNEHREAREALGQALAELGVDEAALRGLLEHDEAWVKQQQLHLDGIKEAQSKARAVLEERSSQLAAHEETNRPDGSEQDARQLAETTGHKLTETQQQLVEEQAKLKADDSQRQRAVGLAERIGEQEKKAEVWKILGDLIGSADGNRLRVFAQSLTLDILLGHANAKLRELTPRYSLERVPGAALALQIVDHDMGDEVRGTKSLSGGESFLVSLALALGLATLSSKRARVESLFVDEGFGALDADSLETVISALDALQATGRQVGVISHVSTVAERVGVRVRVQSRGAGRSWVLVEST